MDVVTSSLFGNSASKYLSKALDDGQEKTPKQLKEEEEAKEEQEKQRAERKAGMAKERSEREKKRQTLRDKYNIQKKGPKEDKSAIEDGIELVEEHIEEIKKKSSCKCM